MDGEEMTLPSATHKEGGSICDNSLTATASSGLGGTIPLPILQALSARFQTTTQGPKDNKENGEGKTTVTTTSLTGTKGGEGSKKRKITTFTQSDLDFVSSYASKNPTASWNLVTKHLNTSLQRSFTTKSVREAYVNRVLNKRERMTWMMEDDVQLCQLVQRHGCKWGEIEGVVEIGRAHV